MAADGKPGHPPNEEKQMTLDIEEAPSNEEITSAKRTARERIRVWQRRTFYSAIALLLGCATVVPFSDGMPLHAYGEPFGNIAVYLSMALLLVLVYCGALWWGAWCVFRYLHMV